LYRRYGIYPDFDLTMAPMARIWPGAQLLNAGTPSIMAQLLRTRPGADIRD